MKEKNKNYRLRSKIYKTAGYATIGASSIGGVSVYNFVIRPKEDVAQELQNALEMFAQNIWIEETGYKLNILLALPFLIGMAIWLIIILRKNKAYFNDKVSLGLLILILILYSVYSVIGYILSTLVGALVGTMISEFGFEPLAKRASEEVDFRNELKREKRRERVRREVRDENGLDGTV